jgi:hypothetical protein
MDTTLQNDAPSGGTYALVAVPDGPGQDWIAVWRDRYGSFWIEAGKQFRRVHRDRADNWVAADGPPLIYARSGRVLDPADEPLSVLDLIGPGPELEGEILALAADRLERGERLDIAAEARVRLARRRLGEATA